MTQFSRKKIISQAGGGGSSSDSARITTLENNEYKVTYYEIISGASGSLTLPTGATINAGEFGLSGNCVLSKIDGSNKPTLESPKTSGGTIVTASLNETTGAWVASGVYTDPSVALIYSIKIKAIDYHNLTYDYIVETVDVGVAHLESPTFTGTPTAPTAPEGTNSTQIATTAYVDSKSLFRNTTDSSTHTGTLTNTIIWSEDISNKLSSGDIAELISDVVRVSGSTAATIRYYLNSSASLSGATQIGIYSYGFSGLNIIDFRRELIVKSSTVIRVKGSVSGLLNDIGAFSNYTDVTVNLASLYVIFAITLGNTGDQFLVSSRKMVR